MRYNNCVRIGEYPKWVAKLLVWLMKGRLKSGVKFKLYGRGKGSAQINFGARPLKYCSRAVIYVYFYDKLLESYTRVRVTETA
jgi:hypothetical protein